MNFLVDAQLPARLAGLLRSAGHDAVHTTDLPEGNRTSDARISKLADEERRVVITKDRDFRDGHLLAASPQRLLLVVTGNITNAVLLSAFGRPLDTIVSALHEADFVELDEGSLTVRRSRRPGTTA